MAALLAGRARWLGVRTTPKRVGRLRADAVSSELTGGDPVSTTMTYQYLFCATCGVRRTGHSFRCTVCDSLLRRVEHRPRPNLLTLQPLVRAEQPQAVPEYQPVAA